MTRKRPEPEILKLPPEETLALFNEHAFKHGDATSPDDEVWCLHCDKAFKVRDVRVLRDPSQSHAFKDGISLECGTPGCDGSPLDWSDNPWWRGDK